MKKAPKVLTRMRLSCCWGDNIDVKELNDVVDYINDLEQQCKKQKQIIDKVNDLLIIKKARCLNEDNYVLNAPDLDGILQVLKEVE